MPARSAPTLTIATVVFNGAGTLRAAMDSVLRQTSAGPLAGRVEYIVVDGGSTDGTIDLLREYDARLSRWISEPDAGIYDAMNKALGMATGDWINFLGADDECLPGLAGWLDRLRDRDTVYHGDVEIAGTGVRSGGRFGRYRLMQENICHQAIFYPRSVYARKRYDTGVGMLADHKYNLELMGDGVRFEHLDAVVARFNDQGVSSRPDPRFQQVKLDTIRRHYGLGWFLVKQARSMLVRMVKG